MIKHSLTSPHDSPLQTELTKLCSLLVCLLLAQSSTMSCRSFTFKVYELTNPQTTEEPSKDNFLREEILFITE